MSIISTDRRYRNRIAKYIYEEWKLGPKHWNSYDVDLTNLSDEQILEEFAYTFEHNPFAPRGKAAYHTTYDMLYKFKKFMLTNKRSDIEKARRESV